VVSVVFEQAACKVTYVAVNKQMFVQFMFLSVVLEISVLMTALSFPLKFCLHLLFINCKMNLVF